MNTVETSDNFNREGRRLITAPGPIPGQQRLPEFDTWPVRDEDGNVEFKATIEVTVQAPTFAEAYRSLFAAVVDMSDRHSLEAKFRKID